MNTAKMVATSRREQNDTKDTNRGAVGKCTARANCRQEGEPATILVHWRGDLVPQFFHLWVSAAILWDRSRVHAPASAFLHDLPRLVSFAAR